MGEVYRARDAKLNRDVALKILPDAFAHDPDRLARFEREATTLAALNHPNIAHIHGFEEAGAIRALVLELVEGPTLADRIAHGPLALADALPIARQIAEALEAAHDQGTIHRDLKPANVKVRDDGTVKVLDFGLAKALDPAGGLSANAMNSPTVTSPATAIGMILGTAAYMSPEQARGRVVDRRADVWAFGAVVFEMLTGRRAFDGDDVSVTLAAVLKEEPDWSAMPADLPASVQRLLRRCLVKDPRRRLRSLGDALLELDEPEEPAKTTTTSAARPQSRWWERAAWAAAVLGLATLVVARYVAPAPPTAQLVRFTVPIPSSSVLYSMAITPDGRRMALVFATPDGRRRLWIRSLDETKAQPVPNTDGAMFPFWSPEGRFVAFFADGKLKKLQWPEGSLVILCDAPNGRGGAWSPDGTIVFAPDGNSGLFQVPAAGGAAPTAATTLEKSGPVTSHRFPQFLPDGRTFLYLAYGTAALGKNSDVYAASLASTSSKFLRKAQNVAFGPPRALLFQLDSVLMTQRFDAERLELGREDPVAIVPRAVEYIGRGGDPGFVVSANGVLAYLLDDSVISRLVWATRDGQMRGVGRAPAAYGAPALDPAGKRAAIEVQDLETHASDIWILDLESGDRSKLTRQTGTQRPAWWSDGKSVVFEDTSNIYRQPIGGESAKLAGDSKTAFSFPSVSPDGKYLVYSLWDPASDYDVWALPLTGEGKPMPLVKAPENQDQARVSPDGHWFADVSTESNREEVYVRPFPAGRDVSQVSQAGGSQPRWRPDGKELFFLASDGKLMTVPVGAGPGFQHGAAAPVFRDSFGAAANAILSYDVARDGRFLLQLTDPTASANEITVVVNWPALVKKN